ncbi:hypothetical protein P7C71_g4001, partial [Lecanoromycetidae sp. Uapishka_2]
MDPQYSLASKDDLWRLQTEMRNVHATQAEHADRLMRLEQRQDAKSAWGTQSPFPSVLNGTPQQDQGYNPAAEAFKNFDQEQSNNMMGSLHLDTDDEPRRDHSLQSSVADLSGQVSEYLKINGKVKEPVLEQSSKESEDEPEAANPETSTTTMPPPPSGTPSVIGSGRKFSSQRADNDSASTTRVNTDIQDSESLSNGTTPDTPSRVEGSNVWGSSWRRDSTQGTRPEAAALGSTSNTGYNRAGRSRGMKVLRPSRANTSRSSSAQQPLGFDAAPSRFADSPKSTTDENFNPSTDRRSVSGEVKTAIGGKPKSANPLGGASAFGWMNSGQQKQSSTTATDVATD